MKNIASKKAKEESDYPYIRRSYTYEGIHYRVCGRTEAEASLKLAKLVNDLKTGMPVKQCRKERTLQSFVDGNVTVKDYSEEWLETYIKPKVRPAGNEKQKNTMTEKSYKMYKQQLETHIIPAIGKLRLKDVKDAQCQKILNNEKIEGFSYSTCCKTKIVLNAMFKQAVKSRIITFNPADDLNVSAEKHGTRRSITEYERECIEEVAKYNKHGSWIIFLLNTGLRPSESAPLQVMDLDFDKKIVKVYKDIESGTENIVSPPKTNAGNRIVPLKDSIIPMMKEQIKGKKNTDFVFTQSDGKSMLTETVISKKWKNFSRQLDLYMGAETTRKGHIFDENDLDSNGIPLYPDEDGKPKNGHKIASDLVLYCLRHTYCTDLQKAGISLNEAKTLMGHSDVTVTANVYTHTVENDVLKIGERINTYEKEKASSKCV